MHEPLIINLGFLAYNNVPKSRIILPFKLLVDYMVGLVNLQGNKAQGGSMSSKAAPFYSHHVFMCTNQRTDGRASCEDCGASDLRGYAKDQVKARGLAVSGGVRINKAGCLNRCDEGPVMVVYPEGVWYRYIDKQDIDEIIDEHLVNGRIVERLRVDADEGM